MGSNNLGKNLGKNNQAQLHRWLIGALATVLGTASAAWAAPTQILKDSLAQPMTFQGMSGGAVSSDCGAIPAQPSQELQLTQEFVQASGYLRFTVEGAGGSPTLLIDGPSGRFCVLADRALNKGPEAVGYWLPGTYKIYVGDRESQSHPFTLSILAN